MVRGIGLIHSMDDIADTMLTASDGAPVLLRDVAKVTIGNQPRLGIAGQDADNDIVQGTVLMRRGEQSMPTIQRVEAGGGKDQCLGRPAARGSTLNGSMTAAI